MDSLLYFILSKNGDIRLKIALVYLGNTLPRYVIDNLNYLKDVVPSGSLIFISEDNKSLEKVARIGIETWKCSDPNDSWNKVKAKLSHPEAFRNGFWFKTTARFFAILEYMQNTEESVLQIEADVWIAKNFPFTKFEEIIDKIAFPLESMTTGAASILWIPNLELMQTLIKFAEIEFSKDGHSTDMTILGQFSIENPNITFVLPSLLSNSHNLENDTSEVLDNSFSQYVQFDGLFDPLTYGLFLLGIDARNSRGYKILFSRPSAHTVPAETYNYSFEEDILHVESRTKEKLPLYCLHVHSKDRSIFNNRRRSRTLMKRIEQSQYGVRKEFEMTIFLKQGIHFLKKKMNR
jgi:hypothetical protein